MTTADSEVIQLAHDRLNSDEATPPNYLVAMLVAAIPTFSDSTPMFSRSEWTDGNMVNWRIVAADGQRLVRIDVVGPPGERRRRDEPPLQASEQKIAITSLVDSVSKVELLVKDRSGRHESGIEWQSSWTIQFADGDSITVPSDREARRYGTREQIDRFIHAFLDLALPR